MRKRASFTMILGVLMTGCLAHGAKVEWVCSTEDKPWKQMPNPMLKEAEPDVPPNVFVKPGRTYQTIDGFGGSFNELGWKALMEAKREDARQVIRNLFGDEGCAFNLARIPIGASDFAEDFYSLDDKSGDYDLKNFSIDRDKNLLLPYIKAAMAVRPELKCWASPWSPPEWMKDPSQYNGGHLRWEPKILNSYANYFSRWIKAYQAEGVNIYAVIPQNEPNQSQVFPSCVWTGSQLAEFIGDYLGPTLKKQNPGIEVWFGINGDWQNDGDNINDRIVTVMEDPKANSFITGMAFQYDTKYQMAEAHELYPDKKLMQSESRCLEGNNSWDDAINRGDTYDLFHQMKIHLDSGANAYFAWNMILDETGMGPWKWRQNAPITVNSFAGRVTYNGEFYVYKHFSHFVKPGAKRIATSGSVGDRIAFVNPDGSIVLVMANTSGNDSEVSIAIGGLSGNDTLKIDLPARSVSTFIVSP